MIDAEGFRNHLMSAELSDHTVRVYTTALRQYAEWYSEVTDANIRDYKKQHTGLWMPGTVNLKLSALSRYCAWKGIRVKIRRIRIQRIPSTENVITPAEFQRLIEGLSADRNERWRVNILILARTGARISEAIRLTKADFLHGSADMATKGKVRRIYIPESLTGDIAGYLETLRRDQTVMLNQHGQPITPQGVNKMLKYLAARYEIPRSHMHPHSFRHFFALEFLKRRNDIALLADILGHASINTTMIYLRKTEEQQKAEINETVDW